MSWGEDGGNVNFPLHLQVTDSIYDLMGNGFTTPLTAALTTASAAAASAAASASAAAASASAASNPAAAAGAAGRASKDERHAHVDRVFQVNQELSFRTYRVTQKNPENLQLT